MSTVYTPWRHQQTLEFGNHRWRKQLLPIDTIEYQGRKIQFTKDYLANIVQAFKDRAIDTVPFQLAGPDNKHTNAIKARKGTVKDLELTSDGLDLILETDEDGNELLSKYPDIGVSARIYENYERSDGKHYPAALQHVLATLDPHIAGMRPWSRLEPVSLSNTSGAVIDLTGARYEGEEESVLKSKTELKQVLAKLRENGDEAELSDDELDLLLRITNSVNEPDENDDSVEGDLTDDELEELLSAADAEDNEDEREPINASNTGSALELANANITELSNRLAEQERRANEAAFQAEVIALANDSGIPPYITQKAKKLLMGGGVIELSNGESVDAGAIVRDILHTFGKQIKVLNLSSLIGSGLPEPDEQREENDRVNTERTDFLSAVKSAYNF